GATRSPHAFRIATARERSARSWRYGAHRSHNGLRLGKARLLLRNLLAIHPDGEFTRAPDDKLGIDSQRVLELGRHPGGLGTVPSTIAVANRHLHGANRSTRNAPARHIDCNLACLCPSRVNPRRAKRVNANRRVLRSLSSERPSAASRRIRMTPPS